jgi:4-diphosphocytidyl-2-C-methyl-D-erythritol kinase
MNVHRLASSVVVRAPAKLNLFFEVLAKRGDGYHEIETLMVSVSLYDSLVVASDPSGRVRVNCRWAAAAGDPLNALGELPAEPDNLATKAVELLRRRAGVALGAEVELIKRIPAAAGLGGGSSDAAAALLAANVAWNLNWPPAALAEVAVELGSDVPFFLGPPAAIGRGRGEQLEPVAGLGTLHFVLVRPPQGLSTGQVYANCQVAARPRSVAPLVDALRSGDPRQLNRLIHNRLEPAAQALSPWIGRLQRELGSQDFLAAQMTGSGTGYFGICRHARHARRVARRLRARGIGRVYALSTSN